jgi:hypothetical protein
MIHHHYLFHQHFTMIKKNLVILLVNLAFAQFVTNIQCDCNGVWFRVLSLTMKYMKLMVSNVLVDKI